MSGTRKGNGIGREAEKGRSLGIETTQEQIKVNQVPKRAGLATVFTHAWQAVYLI